MYGDMIRGFHVQPKRSWWRRWRSWRGFPWWWALAILLALAAVADVAITVWVVSRHA